MVGSTILKMSSKLQRRDIEVLLRTEQFHSRQAWTLRRPCPQRWSGLRRRCSQVDVHELKHNQLRALFEDWKSSSLCTRNSFDLNKYFMFDHWKLKVLQYITTQIKVLAFVFLSLKDILICSFQDGQLNAISVKRQDGVNFV